MIWSIQFQLKWIYYQRYSKKWHRDIPFIPKVYPGLNKQYYEFKNKWFSIRQNILNRSSLSNSVKENSYWNESVFNHAQRFGAAVWGSLKGIRSKILFRIRSLMRSRRLRPVWPIYIKKFLSIGLTRSDHEWPWAAHRCGLAYMQTLPYLLVQRTALDSLLPTRSMPRGVITMVGSTGVR